MALYNSVSLQGRLTMEPEIRYSAGENATASMTFTIAVNRDFKNSEGNYEADFIRCVAWRSHAEFISKYFHKGDPIIVQGDIRTGSYTNKDGQKVYTTDVYVDKVGFTIGGKRNNDNASQGNYTQASNRNSNMPKNNDFMNIPDDNDGEEMPWDR